MSDVVPHQSPTERLDAFFAHLQTMHRDSPPSDYNHFASFLAPDCRTSLHSMREPLLSGRDAAIADLRDHLKYWHLDSWRIVTQIVSADSKIVMCEMENCISILGTAIDPFHQTAVVEFDGDGLMRGFRMYSCQSPVAWVVQKKTGKGPFHEAELREDHEDRFHIRESEGAGGNCCERAL